MYQHMRLYEFSMSMKLLLTGFILAICAAGALGIAAFYHWCRDADGNPAISFEDIRIVTCGAECSVLEKAADRPEEFSLGDVSGLDLELLKEWCRAGAPRKSFPEIAAILKDSAFDRYASGGEQAYSRLASLARHYHPLSSLQLATGTMFYLSVVSVAVLGMGLLFLRTSLFEKTKVFFVSSTFAVVVACPISVWLAEVHAVFLYLMLLSALLLVVCLGVFAVVALNDIWFRRTVT